MLDFSLPIFSRLTNDMFDSLRNAVSMNVVFRLGLLSPAGQLVACSVVGKISELGLESTSGLKGIISTATLN